MIAGWATRWSFSDLTLHETDFWSTQTSSATWRKPRRKMRRAGGAWRALHTRTARGETASGYLSNWFWRCTEKSSFAGGVLSATEKLWLHCRHWWPLIGFFFVLPWRFVSRSLLSHRRRTIRIAAEQRTGSYCFAMESSDKRNKPWSILICCLPTMAAPAESTTLAPSHLTGLTTVVRKASELFWGLPISNKFQEHFSRKF